MKNKFLIFARVIAVAAKDAPIVTPLMDFVRQKREAKGANRVMCLSCMDLHFVQLLAVRASL